VSLEICGVNLCGLWNELEEANDSGLETHGKSVRLIRFDTHLESCNKLQRLVPPLGQLALTLLLAAGFSGLDPTFNVGLAAPADGKSAGGHVFGNA
jgi:hypothetical protein